MFDYNYINVAQKYMSFIYTETEPEITIYTKREQEEYIFSLKGFYWITEAKDET